MYEDHSLAYTGAGITILGTSVSLGWIVAAAIALIVLGVVAYRWSTKNRRYES